MNTVELNKILRNHLEYIRNGNIEKRANLQNANLQNANLQTADFRGADFRGANLRGANLQDADFRDADFRGADFQNANLRGADFRGADLRGADFDFSCVPLWCGFSKVKIDDGLVKQILAHLCSCVVTEEAKIELDKIRDYAKLSHISKDLKLNNLED